MTNTKNQWAGHHVKRQESGLSCSFTGTKGPLIPQVGREPVVTRNVATGGKKNVVIFAQVENAANVVAGPVTAGVGISTKIEYFGPQGEFLGQITLSELAELPVVSIAAAGVDPVPATAVCRPWSPALLEPEREEYRHVATTEPTVIIAGRGMNKGEDAYLG